MLEARKVPPRLNSGKRRKTLSLIIKRNIASYAGAAVNEAE